MTFNYTIWKRRRDLYHFSATIKGITVREGVMFRDDTVVNPAVFFVRFPTSPLDTEYSFSPRKNVVSVVEKGGGLLL